MAKPVTKVRKASRGRYYRNVVTIEFLSAEPLNLDDKLLDTFADASGATQHLPPGHISVRQRISINDRRITREQLNKLLDKHGSRALFK